MTQALGDVQPEALFEGCCRRLHAAGIPLLRSYVSFRTLHPLIAAVAVIWHRSGSVEFDTYSHAQFATTDSWLQSPFHHMLETGTPFLRRRLTGDDTLLDFPVLTEFRDQGATDYLAYFVPFEGAGGDNGIVGSWATDRASGFSDRDIQALMRIQQRLAVACKISVADQISRNVLATYLGPHAGDRVLDGQIKRGDGETIHAVIWYSDLRDSTELAERMPREKFFEVLNGYFDCTAGAVLAMGGEVLLLLGDAVLAIFPIGENGQTESDACAAALRAVQEARDRLDRLNRDKASQCGRPLAFGVGLHVGDVMFGNIGVPERLQFTVVGPAANKVARIEDLTKAADSNVLASAEFARNCADAWDSLGNHVLKGVGDAVEVFAFRAARGANGALSDRSP
jgi:adenylate cyclase